MNTTSTRHPILIILGIIFLVIWSVGIFIHLAGNIIHLALVVGLLLVLMHFLTGRKTSA